MIDFDDKKILVTGGTGSLGKELVRHLVRDERPETVRVLSPEVLQERSIIGPIKEILVCV